MAPTLPEENNFQVDFFKTKRPNKRLREEQETPQIKIDTPSSSNFEITESLQQQPTINANTHPKKVEHLAFKLDRFRGKRRKICKSKIIFNFLYLWKRHPKRLKTWTWTDCRKSRWNLFQQLVLKSAAAFAGIYERYHHILRQNNHRMESWNRKHRKKSENHSREQRILRSAKHHKFQSKHQRLLLKTTQAKKVQSSRTWNEANSAVFIKIQRLHRQRSNYRKKTSFERNGCEER